MLCKNSEWFDPHAFQIVHNLAMGRRDQRVWDSYFRFVFYWYNYLSCILSVQCSKLVILRHLKLPGPGQIAHFATPTTHTPSEPAQMQWWLCSACSGGQVCSFWRFVEGLFHSSVCSRIQFFAAKFKQQKKIVRLVLIKTLFMTAITCYAEILLWKLSEYTRVLDE